MKKLFKILASLLAVVLVLLLSGYIIIYNYISKVNIVAKDAPSSEDSQDFNDNEDILDDYLIAENFQAYYNSEDVQDLQAAEYSQGLSDTVDTQDYQVTENFQAYYNSKDARDIHAVEDSQDFYSTDNTRNFQDTEKTKDSNELVYRQGMQDPQDSQGSDYLKTLDSLNIPVKKDKDVINILLIGSDTRKKGQAGRSDTIILVSINKKKEIITMTSLLRDIYLKIPGRSKNRINSAYAYGGANLLMDTIEENFKIAVDKYVSVDFEAFTNIIDELGGIEVEVTQQDIKVINNFIGESDRLTNEGTQVLNGSQTLAFARNRQVGNADFSRTARQRIVLEKIYSKVRNQNIIELTKLLNKILPQVTTNMTKKEIFSLLLSAPSYLKYDIQQWSVPMKNTYTNQRINGMAVLVLDFEKNIKELHNRIYE